MPKLIKQYNSQQVNAEADETTSFVLYAADYPDISFQRTDGKVKGWIAPVAQGPNNEDKIVAETNVTVGLSTTTKKDILPYNFNVLPPDDSQGGGGSQEIREESYTISVTILGDYVTYMNDADASYFQQIIDGLALPPEKVIIPAVDIDWDKYYKIDKILNYIVPLYKEGYFIVEGVAYFSNPDYILTDYCHFLQYIPKFNTFHYKKTLNPKYLCNSVFDTDATSYKFIIEDTFNPADLVECDNFLTKLKNITFSGPRAVSILPFIDRFNALEKVAFSLSNILPTTLEALVQNNNLMDNIALDIALPECNYFDFKDLLLRFKKGKIGVVDADAKEIRCEQCIADKIHNVSVLIDVAVARRFKFLCGSAVFDCTGDKNILTIDNCFDVISLLLMDRFDLVDVVKYRDLEIYNKESNILRLDRLGSLKALPLPYEIIKNTPKEIFLVEGKRVEVFQLFYDFTRKPYFKEAFRKILLGNEDEGYADLADACSSYIWDELYGHYELFPSIFAFAELFLNYLRSVLDICQQNVIYYASWVSDENYQLYNYTLERKVEDILNTAYTPNYCCENIFIAHPAAILKRGDTEYAINRLVVDAYDKVTLAVTKSRFAYVSSFSHSASPIDPPPLSPPPVISKPARGSVTKTTNSITLTYRNGVDENGNTIPYTPANYIVVDGYVISAVNKGKEMLTPNAIVKWESGNGTETITVVKKFDPRKSISISVGKTKIGDL